MRVVLVSLLFGSLTSVLLANSDTDESRCVEKILLLGGKIERDEILPDNPVSGVSFERCPRVTNQHLHLVGEFKHLRTLQLYGTAVTDDGLRQIAKLSGLIRLELSGQQITDAAFEQIVEMTNLDELTLSDTSVTAEGLMQLRQSLPNLRVSYSAAVLSSLERLGGRIVRDRKITGRPISEIRFMGPSVPHLSTEVQRTLLDANIIDEDLQELRCLKGLDSLRVISLTGCNLITDLGVKEIGHLKNLTTLDLSDCQLVSDFSLECLRELKGLTSLDLSATQITGAGLKELDQLPRLTRLTLSRCPQLTDSDTAALGQLKKLTHLRVTGTQMTDAGVRPLANLTDLQALDLSNNELTDAAMAALEGLKSLTFLELLLCPGITDERLIELRQSLPNVRIRR